MKFRPAGVEVFHVDGKKDRHTWNRFFQFSERV